MRRTALMALVVVGAATGCAGRAEQSEPTLPEAAEEQGGTAAAEPVAALPEAPPCNPAEEDVEPGELATGAQSDRVWAAVRGHLVENPGDLAGTYDIPGDDHGMATLETFRPVERTEVGFVTGARFRGPDHTFDVVFSLRGQCDLEVTEAALRAVDGEPVAAAPAVASTL